SGACTVDHGDPGLEEPTSSSCRLAARRCALRIDDSRGLSGREGIGLDLSQVEHVDDQDVTWTRLEGQLTDARGGPRRAGDGHVDALRVLRHGRYRAMAEASRSSTACARAVLDSSWPDSSRAISVTRASSVTSCTWLRVT